jgi:uridine kinase
MIIAIAGASGSGKTTLARAFVADLPRAALVSTDFYYRDLSHLSPPERAKVNFDHPDAVDWDTLIEHLTELKAGRSAAVPHYDFKSHTRRPQAQQIGPSESTILEGIFGLWHPEIRRLLDLSVFIETADDVCLDRRTYRDVAERGRTPESVAAQWQRHTLPMFREYTSPTRQHADYIVAGTSPPQEHVRRILDLDAVTA